MRRRIIAVGVFLSTCVAHAAPPSSTERMKVIDSVLEHLRTSYLDVEQARKLDPVLRQADFRQVSSEAFAEAVTAAMQGVTKDKHLRLFYSAKEIPVQRNRALTAAEIAERDTFLRTENYGIERVERLPLNIGYLKTRFFAPAAEAAPSIAAAMTLLANTDALIIDLRDNGGGAADAVPLIPSYLFDERTHLGDLYTREGNVVEQQWTYPPVAGSRFGATKPVYILTSKNTFSAAEGMTYPLKNLKRVTVVGETTRGGAHPSRKVRIDAHYEMMLPVTVVRDAVTGKDWEAVGVAPDLTVPAEEALTAAQTAILKRMLSTKSDAASRDEIQKRLAELGSGH